MLHYAAAKSPVQLLPGLAAQFFAHVNCLKKMSKNLYFAKNQLIAQFLQPKKMSKNLSSGFTAFKISQVRYRTQSDPQIVSFFCKSREIAKIGHENTPQTCPPGTLADKLIYRNLPESFYRSAF